ncbi:MAG: very short patch repair endonuclease [Kiritimatiellia bacterium]
MDTMTPEQRRRCMSRIRSKDTAPEWRVRRMVHAMGFRYRLHVKHLPGRPDIVLPRHRKIILVHGCFWHAHGCAAARRMPSTRTQFLEKEVRAQRRARPRRVASALAGRLARAGGVGV